jgi:hypothetical protein
MSFYGTMIVSDGASPEAGAWFVEADHVSVTALARRRWRARLYDERAKSARVIIVSSLFLAFIALALMMGGHAAIAPLLQSAMQAHETRESGDIVLKMRDGIYCRHMSFDNVTAQMNEGAIQRCEDDLIRNRPRPINRGFAWRN